MNARESLAADRTAEEAFRDLEEVVAQADDLPATTLAMRAIAAELRAARVYANYREGRDDDLRFRRASSTKAGGAS